MCRPSWPNSASRPAARPRPKLGSARPQSGYSHRFPAIGAAPTLVVVARPPRQEHKEADLMPRYVVERTFPDGLHIPVNADGAQVCLAVVGKNTDEGVTWVHSYVSGDKHKTFCVYDAPNPEAIRKTANRNSLPVDKITQVSVLDPYFYR